jgi:KaiC/GvpD/RAD55 family RecA-like ATPase
MGKKKRVVKIKKVKDKIKASKKKVSKFIKKNEVKKKANDRKINMGAIASEIKQALVKEQRAPVAKLSKKNLIERKTSKNGDKKEYVKTGIEGFDALLDNGIPKGNSIIVAGGTGSGKTLFCLQTLYNHASKGEKCLYMTFEENEERLVNHMEDFGWKPKELIKKGKLQVTRINPFDITRNVDALLAKQKGELLIDVDPVILPKNFAKPDYIVIDSLTAISSAFTGKEDSYRIYIEQLFRFLEKTGATSFLITETEQVPKIFSQTGVEEFLADGVIVLYAIKHGNVRENAIEILKLRGASHQKKIVAMQITSEGVMIYPEQEVFSEID